MKKHLTRTDGLSHEKNANGENEIRIRDNPTMKNRDHLPKFSPLLLVLPVTCRLLMHVIARRLNE